MLHQFLQDIEIWGYPKKYASPDLRVDVDTLLGTLKYNSTVVAAGSMGYKYQTLDGEAIQKDLEETPILCSRSYRM